MIYNSSMVKERNLNDLIEGDREMTYTAEQIKNMKIGDIVITNTFPNGYNAKIVEIFVNQKDINGKQFIAGYQAHGKNNSKISFSIKENEEVIRY